MGEFLLDHQQHNCITISPHLLDWSHFMILPDICLQTSGTERLLTIPM
jgi:hypothetical protein